MSVKYVFPFVCVSKVRFSICLCQQSTFFHLFVSVKYVFPFVCVSKVRFSICLCQKSMFIVYTFVVSLIKMFKTASFSFFVYAYIGW